MGRRALERLAFEKGIRSGGRESACPRPMSLKTALFRLIDGSAVFEMAAFQKQNALGVRARTPFLSRGRLPQPGKNDSPGAARMQEVLCGAGRLRHPKPAILAIAWADVSS